MDQQTQADAADLAGKLANTLGAEHVLTDPDQLLFFSTDFSERRLATAAVVARPGSTEDVVTAVKLAAEAGFKVTARGGGMSYTLGFVPRDENTLVLDMQRMNRILEINTDDLYMTLEPGVTWKQLSAALKGLDCRMPYLGTMSGTKATIGGGLGNNATGVGVGDIGDSLIGMEIVLADGRIVYTGGWSGADRQPTLRGFGPDLTGLFVHDNGAFGVKTKATFRLSAKPAAAAFGSFGFMDRHKFISAMSEMSRQNLAGEILGLGNYHHHEFANSVSPPPKEGLAILREVVRQSSSTWRGLIDAFRAARPMGLGFLKPWELSIHVTAEGFNQSEADARMREVRRIVRRFGGKGLPPMLPIGSRVDPFPPIEQLMVGTKAQCSFPSNCTVPFSRAHELSDALDDFFAENANFMKENDLEHTRIYIMLKNMFGTEPIIYWRDRLNPLRLSVVSPERRDELAALPANTKSREAALDLRHRMVNQVFLKFSATHFQIGKYYPYKERMRTPATWEMIEGVKELVDSDRRMNPGALGLD